MASNPPYRVNVEALHEQLLGTWASVRREARARCARPELHRIEGLTAAEHRERVFGQLKLLVEMGAVHRAFPTSLGGQDDPGGNLAAFEELIIADPSLQIKAGVQWGLFGAAVLHLGTSYHHARFLPDIMSLAVPGAFAMTETGHGSDVQSLGTTATYDPTSQEFVITTPSRAAWKDYIGNAAVDGTAAVVFAQLITRGESYGVHALYVPIRDESGAFLPGVGGEDNGLKGGLNGIDNGRLHFTEVRVPRRNLLNKYGDVAEDGTYSSPIESPGRRFFTMLSTLVQGRVSLDGAATNAAAMAITIAVTYGNRRRQFAPGHGEDEMLLLDYQHHQRRLLPKLAATYAHVFAHDELLVAFDEVFSATASLAAADPVAESADSAAESADPVAAGPVAADPTVASDDQQEQSAVLEILAAAFKPLSTWHALDTLQVCREASGGAGYLAENRLVGLRQDLDVYTTFEGDNTVLLQLVAKQLVAGYAALVNGIGLPRAIAHMTGVVTTNIFQELGVRRLSQRLIDGGSLTRAMARVRDVSTQHALLAGRLEGMIIEFMSPPGRGASKSKSGADVEVFPNRHQSELIDIARAYGELQVWEAFTKAVDKIEDLGTREVVGWLRDLYGLSLLEQNLAWYLLRGRLSAQRARAVSAHIDKLLAALRPHAQDLVDAFGFTDDHLRATIAASEPRGSTHRPV